MRPVYMATVYFSRRCRFSEQFLRALDAQPDVAARVTATCVEDSGAPKFLSTVPAVVEDQSLYEGKEAFAWLRKKKEEALAPFVYETWGPSPTTMFSFVDEENGYAHRQDAFGAFGADEVVGTNGDSTSGQAPGVLEALIEKRKQEVPEAIKRT